MVPASARSARWIESKNWHSSVLPSPEKVPPDPHTCPRMSHWISFSYDPVLLQAAASALGLRVSEFVYKPFKSWVSVSHSLWLSWTYASPVFKARCYGGLYSWCREADVGLRALVPHGGTSMVVISFPLVGCCIRVIGLTRPRLCTTPVSMWPFLCILSCGLCLLLVCRFWNSYSIYSCTSVCLWEEVSSGPSCFPETQPFWLLFENSLKWSKGRNREEGRLLHHSGRRGWYVLGEAGSCRSLEK